MTMTETAAPRLTVKASHPSGEVATLAALPAKHPSRPALRSAVIQEWRPLAHHLASRFANRGEPFDDLFQTATVGLIKAVDRYDPSHGVEFVAYAVPTIVGEIKRYFRDRTWNVRVPRRLQELRLAITEATGTVTHQLHRSPTVADLAAHLRVSEEQILEGLEAARAYHGVSLSTPATGDDHTTELGDMIGSEDAEFAQVELRAMLGPALATLDRREQQIVMLRFYGNLTQSQIAARIGISQMHVSRLLARALGKLREALANADPDLVTP